MRFEDELRNEIKSLPVGELTEFKRQQVLHRVQTQVETNQRRSSRMIPSTITTVAAVAGIFLGTITGMTLYYRSISVQVLSTETLASSVLNTSDFHNAVLTYLHSSVNPSETSGRATANHTAVSNLTVKWSQTSGNFGFACVSYDIDHQQYLAGVVARMESNSQWNVLKLDPMPMTQVNDDHQPVFNVEMSSTGTGSNVMNYPTYFMGYGIVKIQTVTHVRITWHDGHHIDVPVVHGVYGYVQTYSFTSKLYGPTNIQALNDQGHTEWSLKPQ